MNTNVDMDPRDIVSVVNKIPSFLTKQMQRFPVSVYLSGGFIRNAITGEQTHDIDIFLASDSIRSAIMLEMNQIVWLRGKNSFSSVNIRPIVQLYFREYFPKPESILLNADFTICACAVWWTGERWTGIVCERFYSDLAAKRLVFINEKEQEELGGLLRAHKLMARGYNLPVDELAKFLARFSSSLKEGALGKASIILQRLRDITPPIKW